MRQSLIFDVVGKLCSVRVVRVEMSVELFKRTENTEKELGVRRSGMAHEFDGGDELRQRDRRCVKEIHRRGRGGFGERRRGVWCWRGRRGEYKGGCMR